MSTPEVIPWPNNDNPDCSRESRCGCCRKDVLAAATLRSWQSGVYTEAQQLRYNRWTPREIDILRANAGQPLSSIQTILKRECGVSRTIFSVRNKANKSGIRLKWRDYTTTEIARAFGVAISTVQDWIKDRHLLAYRWNTSRSSKWLISRAAAESFIRSFPWVYELGQMDTTHPLYLVARTVNRGEQWLNCKQVGSSIGLSKGHVRDLARRGVLPGYRRGNWWLFRHSELPAMKAILKERTAENKERLRTEYLRMRNRAA